MRRASARKAARNVLVVAFRKDVGRPLAIGDDDGRAVVARSELHADTILLFGTHKVILAHIGKLGRGAPRGLAERAVALDVLRHDGIMHARGVFARGPGVAAADRLAFELVAI